jgi:pantoate--beta-alanine ligase
MTVPDIVSSAAELSAQVASWRELGQSIAFVPTMGALHEGHKKLVTEACAHADRVVVSIYVNPLQFGQGEDFEQYPRDLAQDAGFLREAGVDVIFAPHEADIYPDGKDRALVIDAGEVGALFEGAERPGHFGGMLTVVKRFLDIVHPHVLVMGEKDAQQLFLVAQMVKRERLPVTLVPIETVRDSDGVALSSRNAYLSPPERVSARVIFRALIAARHARDAEGARAEARAVLAGEKSVEIDYLETVDPGTFLPIVEAGYRGEARMIVAVTLGATRLIDNTRLTFGQ